MEPRRAALVVAALLLLSGCTGSAFGPSATTTSTTETQTTVSQNATNTTTASSPAPPQANATTGPTNNTTESLPPGVNRTGVEDAEEMVAAHQQALNSTSFAFQFRANVSAGPASQWTSQRGSVEEGLSPLMVQSESLRQVDNGTTRVGTDLWANDTSVVAQYRRANRTELRHYNRTGGNLADETWSHLPRADLDSQVTQSWLLEFALSVGEYDLAEVERRDGNRVAVLRATEAANATNFTDLNATIVVDSVGRVRSLSLTAAYANAEENRIRYEFELTEVGNVSVTRPAWVGAAIPPNETTTTVAGTTTIKTQNTTTA
ncbi:hypothetical protein [Halorussus ruber]|uniref:hypothetical protein n=1 Tax=Halorussus ruber TaxID=1126238 RepID=UPI001092B269|nr:hypothetical protein [Halorussus ruber]